MKKLAAVTASKASRNEPASSSGTRNNRSLARNTSNVASSTARIATLAATATTPVNTSSAVGAEAAAQREATPLVNTASSLLITAGLTLTAFAITQPVVNLEPGVTINAVPAAFAVVLIALFVMTTRLHAVSQAAGFLMLDNGIAATAFLLTAGVPLIVELGASLDVLFAVIVIGVLTGRLRRIFGDADLDKLRELRD